MRPRARRAPAPPRAWPGGAAKTDFRQAECGIAHYSRHYRLRPDVAPPGSPLRRMVAALDEFLVGIWRGAAAGSAHPRPA
jgi:hypothetical protein